MECLFYLKERPPLCQRKFIFTGRSGRHLEKGYMYGPAVPFIKGISILPQGAAASFIKDIPNPPAASLLKGIYMYWTERPPLSKRIYVWSGRPFYKGDLYFTSRSGRFFHKGYTEPSGRLFAKGNLYVLEGAAATLKKDICMVRPSLS